MTKDYKSLGMHTATNKWNHSFMNLGNNMNVRSEESGSVRGWSSTSQ